VVGITVVLAGILAAAPAQAAPEQSRVAAPDAALAADVCWSWTDYVTTTGIRYNIYIPSTTRNGNQSNCVLYNGITSDGVLKLQDALNYCYGQGLRRDGVYGPATEAAVENVQRFHGFPPEDIDGWYGPQTRAAMVWPKFRNSVYHHCW